MFDLVLAIAHHLLIFALFGVLAVEFVVVRPGVSHAWIARIAQVDLWYGILAAAILAVGFSRAVFAAKGWLYYSHNAFFWAKIATFALVGLLSVPPTIAYIRWRRADGPPGDGEVRQVRRLLWAEVILFALLPAFAAAMARGYGEFS
jgi:putative membrane protein